MTNRKRITKIRITGQSLAYYEREPEMRVGPKRRTLSYVKALKYVNGVKEQLRKEGYTKLWTVVERK